MCIVPEILGAGYPQHRAAHHEGGAHRKRSCPRNRLTVEFRSVTALEIGEKERPIVDSQLSVFSRNVAIEGYARFRHGVVTADYDLMLEMPRFAIERTAENLEQVHGRQAFEEPVPSLLVVLIIRQIWTITHRVTMNDRIDELLHLIEVEPDALREAEFFQAQAILETLVGKVIADATIEDTRIVISTEDGNRYFFYGFIGSGD